MDGNNKMTAFMCNFLIAGVGKSGTSSLHAFLDSHPEICMSSTKEPHFFSIDEHWAKGADAHNNLFSRQKPQAIVFGESSTTYFASEVAMHRIKSSLNTPKIVLVLRDPVDRVVSHYRWMFALGLEDRPILRAVEESGFEFNPNVSIRGNYKSYIEFSLYSKWVPMWIEHFGADNVALVMTDDLKHKRRLVFDECCRFLGVSNFAGELPKDQNQTESVTNRSEKRVGKIIRTSTPRSVRRALIKLGPTFGGMWNALFINEVRIVPPQISGQERDAIAKILAKETDYYSLIRSQRAEHDVSEAE